MYGNRDFLWLSLLPREFDEVGDGKSRTCRNSIATDICRTVSRVYVRFAWKILWQSQTLEIWQQKWLIP